MYKATLIRQFRDAYTGSPKVLLQNITTLEGTFRDHAWVELTPALNKLLNRYNKCTIYFEAEEVTYLKRGIEPAKTLKITNILRHR